MWDLMMENSCCDLLQVQAHIPRQATNGFGLKVPCQSLYTGEEKDTTMLIPHLETT